MVIQLHNLYFYMMNQATNSEAIENCFPYFYVEQEVFYSIWYFILYVLRL